MAKPRRVCECSDVESIAWQNLVKYHTSFFQMAKSVSTQPIWLTGYRVISDLPSFLLISAALSNCEMGRLLMSEQHTKLTPPQIASRWGVSVDKILTWIRTGELLAMNAATKVGGRPRYLVDVNELAKFEAKRTVARETADPSKHRRKRATDAIEFF